MSKIIEAPEFQQEEHTERDHGVIQIDICGHLVQEALFKAIVDGLEDLAIYITNGGNNEKDDKYDSYAVALRILK